MDDKTEQTEQEVLDNLVAAWNRFVKLPSTHGDDLPDFRRAIHECQRIMATRQVRRSDPDRWVSNMRSKPKPAKAVKPAEPPRIPISNVPDS